MGLHRTLSIRSRQWSELFQLGRSMQSLWAQVHDNWVNRLRLLLSQKRNSELSVKDIGVYSKRHPLSWNHLTALQSKMARLAEGSGCHHSVGRKPPGEDCEHSCNCQVVQTSKTSATHTRHGRLSSKQAFWRQILSWILPLLTALLFQPSTRARCMNPREHRHLCFCRAFFVSPLLAAVLQCLLCFLPTFMVAFAFSWRWLPLEKVPCSTG